MTRPIHVLMHGSPEFDELVRSSGVDHAAAAPEVVGQVRTLFEQIRSAGDGASRFVDRVSHDLDGRRGTAQVDVEELTRRAATLPPDVADSLRLAYQAQLDVARAGLAPDVEVEVGPGITTRLVRRAIRRVALYVPGGRERYPSTLVSLLASARAAGVDEVTVVLPPSDDGEVDPACAWLAMQHEADTVLCGNGPALIAALALRVDGLPRVDLVIGPGGPAVVAAQQLAAEHGLASGPSFGPTDCAVVAGPDADPDLLVADLLTESEHGHDPRLVLLGWGGIEKAFLAALEQDRVGQEIWTRTGRVVVCDDEDGALAAACELGGEQVQLATDVEHARELLPRVHGFASVLLGQDTSISAAYLTGAPGCLPTGPAAAVSSVVTAESFRRTMVVGEVRPEAQAHLAQHVATLATYEGFPRHAASQQIRI